MRLRDLIILSATIALWAWSSQQSSSPAAPAGTPTAATRATWQRSSVRVNGISLGSSLQEVRAQLGSGGEPSRVGTGTLFCWKSGGQPTQIWFQNDRAVRISGPHLTVNGQQVSIKQLGAPHHEHHYGYFGSPVLCWEHPGVIVEMFSSHGVGELTSVTLVDPHIQDPHFPESPAKGRRSAPAQASRIGRKPP